MTTPEHEEVEVVTPSDVRARHYGYILKNGVQCIIIDDPQAKMASAAMSIRAGQLNDPENLPGLAHFCEHMLFMGTAKYPREDEYDSYVKKHGGTCNAWTSLCNTTFFFTVAMEALIGGLERFLEFFVAPNFDAGALSREVQAVHSEDEKNHSSDFWAVDEIDRGLIDSRHPRHRYGNGNATTLRDEPRAAGVDVRAELCRFFSQHYVSGAACLVVHSALPPAAVLRAVEEPMRRMRFGRPAGFSFLPRGAALFNSAAAGAWINVRTVRKSRSVRIKWAVASPAAAWRSAAGLYVSHLLGHECDVSVLGVLRRANWAMSMVAGPMRVDDDYEIFYVEIALTPDGLRHILDVIDTVYEGIAIAARVDASVYAQVRAEGRLSFESSEVGAPAEHCSMLATAVHAAGVRDCWIAGEFALSEDIAAEEAYTAQLTPDRAVITLKWGEMPCESKSESESGARKEKEGHDTNEEPEEQQLAEEEEKGEEDNEEKGAEEAAEAAALFESLPEFARVPCDRVARFHRAKYSLFAVPPAVTARWAAKLNGSASRGVALPPANPFLAANFSHFDCDESADAAPHGLGEPQRSAFGVIRVRPDADRHRSFKTAVTWFSHSPVAAVSPRSSFFMRVMCSIITDAVAEVSYFGTLAALENTISRHTSGLSVLVVGPQDRLADFFLALFERVLTPSTLVASEEKFCSYAEAARRSLASNATNKPYELVSLLFEKTARVVCYTFDEVLAESTSVTYADYTAFVQEYIAAGLYYEFFVSGNVPNSRYVRSTLVEPLEQILQRLGVKAARREDIPRFRDVYAFASPRNVDSRFAGLPCIDVLSFPPFDPSNSNVAVLFNVYLGPETPALRAQCDCLYSLLSSRFFNALRTRESLGYVVYVRPFRCHGAAHLQFVVQSAVSGVDGLYLLSRILAFLSAAESRLDAVFSADGVSRAAQSLAERRRKIPNSVEADCADLSIRHAHPSGAAHKEAEIAELERTKAENVRRLFCERVANKSPARQALAVVVHSAASAQRGGFFGADGKWRAVQLPPVRKAEEEKEKEKEKDSGDADETKREDEEEALQLPDFVAEPMSVALRTYASPAMYSGNFPILRSEAI